MVPLHSLRESAILVALGKGSAMDFLGGAELAKWVWLTVCFV